MENLRPREVFFPGMQSQEGAELRLECGSPKFETRVSTSLLDVTCRDFPGPSLSFWPGLWPCCLPIRPKDLTVHLPGAASQGALGILMGDPTPPGWILSQLQCPSQAHGS